MTLIGMIQMLTPQREKFAREVASGKSQADAYRAAYPKSLKWTDRTVWNRASELMANSGVKGRVSEIQEAAAVASAVTIDSLIKKLEKVCAIALTADTPQCSAAVSAHMAQAKLLGLFEANNRQKNPLALLLASLSGNVLKPAAGSGLPDDDYADSE